MAGCGVAGNPAIHSSPPDAGLVRSHDAHEGKRFPRHVWPLARSNQPRLTFQGVAMKVVALLIGIALLALGVAGFVPALNENGMLFGVVPANPVICGLFVI